MAKLKELYQHELNYLGSLGKLSPEPPAPADPVETAAEEIQANMDRIVQEEVPTPAESEGAPSQEDQRPGGLYSDLTASLLNREEGKTEPEHPAAAAAEPPKSRTVPEDEEPTKRLSIDLEHLQFGKDYQIK